MSFTLLVIAYSSVHVADEVQEVETPALKRTLLIPNTGIESVFVYLVFPSGEAQNGFDEGLAHYVEHLAWLSALGDGQDRSKRHSNAWTTHLSTGYWLSADADSLNSALRDLVAVANPFSVEPRFASEERNVVLREYDYRVKEQALYSVFRDMDRTIYGNGALARSVIGQPEVIADYSLEKAKALHEKSHSLADATLLVYGNVSKKRLAAILSSMSDQDVGLHRVNPALPELVEAGTVKDRIEVSLQRLSEDTFIYRKLVPLGPCDVPVGCQLLAEIAEHVLGSSLPEGVAGPLRFDQFVARSFSLEINIIENQFVEIFFIGQPDEGVSLVEVESVFLKAFSRTLEDGLSRKTFDRVASRFVGRFESVLKHERPRYNRDLVLEQIRSGAPIFTLDDQFNMIEVLDLEEVNKFLKYLLIEGREVTRLVSAGK